MNFNRKYVSNIVTDTICHIIIYITAANEYALAREVTGREKVRQSVKITIDSPIIIMPIISRSNKKKINKIFCE